MAQKDKELLLKDLCGRLPYGVKCATVAGSPARKLIQIATDRSFVVYLSNDEYIPSGYPIDEVKPYLRPMSSMTQEEKKEYADLVYCVKYAADIKIAINEIVDWLNEHHFDYRGLIEKGLAIEVTKENNPYKE